MERKKKNPVNHERPLEAHLFPNLVTVIHCVWSRSKGPKFTAQLADPDRTRIVSATHWGQKKKIENSRVQYILFEVISNFVSGMTLRSQWWTGLELSWGLATKEERSTRTTSVLSTPPFSCSWDAPRALMCRRTPAVSPRDMDGLQLLQLWFIDKDIQPPIHDEGPSVRVPIHFAASKQKRTRLDSR